MNRILLAMAGLALALPQWLPATAAPACEGRPATIVGTPAADVLVGTAGDDVIAGLGGDDVLLGLSGDDTICPGSGSDLADGGIGRDTISYSDWSHPVDAWRGITADLGVGRVIERSWTIAGLHVDGDIVDRIAGFEIFTGSSGDDRINGSETGDDIRGGAGHDEIVGRAGSDRLDGGDGGDRIEGGPHGPLTAALTDHDMIIGGAGSDHLVPAWGGSSMLFGGDGDDVFEAYDGRHRYDGGPGTDRVGFHLAERGVRVDLTIAGPQDIGFGTQTFTAIERLWGSRYDDILAGSAADEDLSGFDGDDVLDGRGGSNTADGGAGTDTCMNAAKTRCEQ